MSTCFNLHNLPAQFKPNDEGYQDLTVFIATWNVGNAPPPDDLSPWIPKEGHDIIVVGAQECGYDPREGYFTCQEDWDGVLIGHLGSAEYEQIISFCITPMANEKIQEKDTLNLRKILKANTLADAVGVKLAEKHGIAALGEIRLSVFVKRSLRPYIQTFNHTIQTTGRLDGISGNKGGLGLSMQIGETWFTFITGHLNAHAEFMERRNEDCKAIFKGLTNGFPGFESIQTHYAFFFGDLNYRIVLEHQETLDFISEKNWRHLYKNEQLQDQQAKKKALANFREHTISWAPTFKVKRKMDLTYSTERVPSYCDRILWKAFPSLPVEPIFYRSVEEFKTSDHKPVHGAYKVQYFDPSLNTKTPPITGTELVLTDFKAINLDLTGLEKPHVHLVAAISTNPMKATISEAVPLSAIFEAAKFSHPIPVNVKESKDLRNVYLLLGIRLKGDLNVRLGEGVFPLAHVGAESVNVQVDLYQLALPCGQLKGKITLH